MACSWSPENATKAFISTLKMERRTKEPNSAEFISALAAGNNAQLMIAAPSSTTPTGTTTSILLALVAAAQQTGGRVACIVPNTFAQSMLKLALGSDAAERVEFVAGDARDLLLLNKYLQTADFVVVDCNLERYENVVGGFVEEGSASTTGKSVTVLGYNAFCKRSSWQWGGLKTHLLPIGDGLLVTKIPAAGVCRDGSRDCNKRSRWVVKVDECTGEEHVFRIRSPQHRKGIVV